MPAKNSLKDYIENGYYHLYNRGVAKNNIFVDQQDYAVLLSYLKEYLSPPIALTPEQIIQSGSPYQRNNFYEEIRLLAYCLMPNHFHLLLHQNEPRSIETFMRSVFVRYSGYFNKRHDRVGHVFQDVYKGVLIKNDEHLWWLSRYIHRNSLEILASGQPLSSYPYSSYASYLGLNNKVWLDTSPVLSEIKDYSHFVENDPVPGIDIDNLVLE